MQLVGYWYANLQCLQKRCWKVRDRADMPALDHSVTEVFMNDCVKTCQHKGQRRLSDREIARKLLRVYDILGLFDGELSAVEAPEEDQGEGEGSLNGAANVAYGDDRVKQPIRGEISGREIEC
jgi:hypothetical protein